MSRYRLRPTPEQEKALREHCAHARYVWNLAVEQHSWWRRGRGSAPGYCAQAAQLTEARAEFGWLAGGTGLNRGILASGWGLLARRLEDKAPGRVEKINPAYTSQRCSACGHVAADSRESQALFRCTACGYTEHADVNAARNTAAGHAVAARGRSPLGGRVNREPQPLPLSA
jgi:transposase